MKRFSLLQLNAPNSRLLVSIGMAVTVPPRTTPPEVDSNSSNDADNSSSSNSKTLVVDVEGQKLGRLAVQLESASLPHYLVPRELLTQKFSMETMLPTSFLLPHHLAYLPPS
jgi:hypothetical protein